MKKMGFTLMEVLVALAIVVVGATLIIPALNGLRPDANKVKLLKVNKVTKETINELLSDSSLYRDNSNNNCKGLNCMILPTSPKFSNVNYYKGNSKFPNLFASRLSLVDEVSGGSNGPWIFQTTDGIYWKIAKIEVYSTSNIYKFTVDVNGLSTGENCIYGDANCEVPDTFTFEIDKWGNFSNRDKLMRAYLENPLKLKEKEKDFLRAKNISESDAPANLTQTEQEQQENEQRTED